jgi:hypothetical protein
MALGRKTEQGRRFPAGEGGATSPAAGDGGAQRQGCSGEVEAVGTGRGAPVGDGEAFGRVGWWGCGGGNGVPRRWLDGGNWEGRPALGSPLGGGGRTGVLDLEKERAET